ncbi:MAG: DUF3737 family protein [Ruminococcus sp.]|nr:DUF3737 family protein [Ruminococcus sp.]
MKEIHQKFLTGERALFQTTDMKIYDTIFDDGESPLKHSRNIELYGSMFKWKYPLWYSENITMKNCSVFEMGRAGIWYTNNITVKDTIIEAPKNFRRCSGVMLERVNFSNASETLWNCNNITLRDVTAKGDYLAMNCSDIEIDGLKLVGNYSFDGGKNIVVRNSTLLSKDAFWNCENVTVYDSFISGEYLAWNSKNITFINCTIESLQGLCYIDNLVMKNCRLINTTLAFEYSKVNAEIVSHIDSVKNSYSGVIKAKSVGEIIMEDDKVDTSKTKIICEENL